MVQYSKAPTLTGGPRRTRRRWMALAAAVLVVSGLTMVEAASSSGAATAPGAANSAHLTPAPSGYWLAAGDGGAFAYGDAGFHGSMGGQSLNSPVVGMARTPSSNGYWEVAADGGIFAFGDAGYYGSMGGQHLNSPVVGMSATPTGQGYWEVAADGGLFAFGDAGYYGSMGGQHLNSPVVGMSAVGTGNGYWEVAADGGIFTFGAATFHGSMGGQHLNSPVVGMSGTLLSDGYWEVAADGGVFAFGDAAFHGSMGGQTLNSPVVGVSATTAGGGYAMAASDGGVFAFGDAVFRGSAGGLTLHSPVVAIAQIGPTVGGRVLLVGTFHGVAGQYKSIQDAVDVAHPGDWILIAPGDYHEQSDVNRPPTPSDLGTGRFGGVNIQTPNIHLRGMDRRSVIVDGTKPTAATACSNAPADQNFGATVAGSTGPIGRNGILVWKTDGVSVDNLTTCNFLTGSGGGGNEVWWNGVPSGATSGRLGIVGYSGRYLTTTSTYYDPVSKVAGGYGIFSSAASLGVWNNIYGSNFNDSGTYVGACRQLCDAWINNAWMEYNPLGYSGTNSGGTLVISNSEIDNNKDGFDTNTQIAGDPPPVQNGACAANGVSGLTGTQSCWVFMNNNVHDNNNPSVPQAGFAALGPVGTGMTLSGARNDTVMNNTFANNGAWGTLFLPFPDTDTPPSGTTCIGTGGTDVSALGFGCLYDAWSNALLHNTFQNNGSFGNPTNGDFANLTFATKVPQNCFAGNTYPAGSTPNDLEATNPTCGTPTTSSNFSLAPGTLGGEVLCNTGLLPSSCGASDHYPRPGTVTLKPLPSNLPSMPNPCVGVAANAWCPAGKPV